MFGSMKHLEYRSSGGTSAEKADPDDIAGRFFSEARLAEIKISSSLTANIDEAKKILGNGSDLILRNLTLGRTGSRAAAVLFIGSLIDSFKVDGDIIRPLVIDAYVSGLESGEAIISQLERGNLITGSRITSCGNMKELMEGLLNGEACLLISGMESAFSICVKGNEKRSITEAQNEPVIRGSKDAFVESLSVNIGLIRMRIPNPNLSFETIEIGTQTHTKVCISYIRGICPASRISEMRSRIKGITIDGILESGYLEEFIQDNPFSIFPQLRNTERPDVVSAALLEGRVAVITDNTPIALIAPGELFSLLQSAEDYYDRYIFSSFVRILRFFAFLLAALLPAFYIAVTNYHQEMVPTDLLMSIESARTGVPIPTVLETLVMILALELLYEAGVRLPKSLGQTISIVGALIIGQAAVQAKIVSPLTVIVVSLTGIATFCIPQYNLALPVRMIRLVFILLSSLLGLFGMMAGILYVLLHLSSLRSFGVAYLAPLSPREGGSLKDTVIRSPWWAFVKRPPYISANSNRMASRQKPVPPGDKN